MTRLRNKAWCDTHRLQSACFMEGAALVRVSMDKVTIPRAEIVSLALLSRENEERAMCRCWKMGDQQDTGESADVFRVDLCCAAIVPPESGKTGCCSSVGGLAWQSRYASPLCSFSVVVVDRCLPTDVCRYI